MNTSTDKSRQVYTADFKTPLVVRIVIWILLIVGAAVYLWITGEDVVEEFRRTSDEIMVITLGILFVMTVLPALGWQKVEVEKYSNSLRYRNVWDLLLGRTREFKLNDIVTVETKSIPKFGDRIHLEFQDGTTQRINKTNLEKGWELEALLREVADSQQL